MTETTGVYITGTILALIIVQSIGIDTTSLIPSGPSPDFLSASLGLVGVLIVLYTVLFGLVYLIGRWHRRRPARAYGLTLNSRPVKQLVFLGILAFVFADLPAKLVKLAQEYLPLGPIPETHAVLEIAEWLQWEFWLYMAVGSFVVVAILEEVFFRGYIQTRLAEDFGGTTAIMITSFFFAFAHVQYLYIGFFGVSNIVATLIAGFAFGYLYERTGSLIPSIIMHMMANVPLVEPGITILVAVMLIGVFRFRERLVQYLRDFWDAIQSIPEKGTVVFFVAYATLFAVLYGFSVPIIFIVGIVSVPIALFLEYREKKQTGA